MNDTIALAVLTLAFVQLWIYLDAPTEGGRHPLQRYLALAGFIACLGGTILQGIAA